VAASGNGLERNQRGPLYPAAWEAEQAPNLEQCKKLVREDWPFIKDLTAGDSYRPLAYAAGAVDARDVPLPITRPGSLPRMVGYGITVVNDDPVRAPGQTQILTGSSLGAADVSGVAAAIWSLEPSVTAHALMADLYAAAVRLSPTTAVTEHCLGGSCAMYPVARVSLCELALKVTGQPLPCETVPAGAGSPADQPPPAGPPTTFGPPIRCKLFLGHLICLPMLPRTTPASPDSDAPWVLPQPNLPSCPTCRAHRYSGTVSGYLQPDPSWGIIDADLFTTVPGSSPVRYIPANTWFYTWLGGTIPPTAVSAGFVLYGVIGTFWSGSGVMDVIDD
jgi:hypothetical protein